jgi:hypothetical protein
LLVALPLCRRWLLFRRNHDLPLGWELEDGGLLPRTKVGKQDDLSVRKLQRVMATLGSPAAEKPRVVVL